MHTAFEYLFDDDIYVLAQDKKASEVSSGAISSTAAPTPAPTPVVATPEPPPAAAATMEPVKDDRKVILTDTALSPEDEALLHKMMAAIQWSKETYVIKQVTVGEAQTMAYAFYFSEHIAQCSTQSNGSIMAPSLRTLATDTAQKQELWGYMKALILSK